MSQPLRKSTATTVTVGPIVDATDGVTPETGLATGTVDEISIYKHEATSFTDIKGDTTLVHRSGGVYTVTLDEGDTSDLGRLTLIIRDDDVCRPHKEEFTVVPANVYDALVAGTDYLQSDAHQVEGADATDQIRDAVVNDATRLDASALNTLSGHDPGETIAGESDITGLNDIEAADVWGHTSRTLTSSAGSVSSLDVEVTDNSVTLDGSIRNFYPGETLEVDLEFCVDSVLQDISGDTVTFTMKSAKSDGDASAVIQKDADVATDGANGVATLTLTNSDTDSMPPGDYFCDVVWTTSGGSVRVAYDNPVQVLTRVSDA